MDILSEINIMYISSHQECRSRGTTTRQWRRSWRDSIVSLYTSTYITSRNLSWWELWVFT